MPSPYCYEYPRPAVSVDLAIFGLVDDGLRVLLVRRGHDPFAGSWALPGGFLGVDEPIEAAARRELEEETGFEATGPVAFIGAFGDPDRDPRTRNISLAHAAVIRGPLPEVAGADDAAEAAWRPATGEDAVSGLAFDHDKILGRAVEWLASGVRDGDLGPQILPERFDRESVGSLFRALYGSDDGVDAWLGRMARDGRIGPDPEGVGRYRSKLG